MQSTTCISRKEVHRSSCAHHLVKLDYKKGNPVLCNDLPRPLYCQACFRCLKWPSPALSERWVSEEDVQRYPSENVSRSILLTKPIGKDINNKMVYVVCQWHYDWLKRLWHDGRSSDQCEVIRGSSSASSSGGSGSGGSNAL